MAANPELVGSLSSIESDTGGESFRATYDSTRDSASLAVISVISAAREEDPQDSTPLQTVIDTDALDKLMLESAIGRGACDSIRFRHGGFEITVTSEGVIEANPTEET